MEVNIQNQVLLPTKILNKQLCSKCLNYLSVGPIMISTENKPICGRCTRSCEHQDELKYSLFNIVAEVCIFSCINHYSGCIDMLSYAETKNHENVCPFGTIYSCWECSFKGNGCRFVNHYEQCHPEHLARNGVFSIPSQNAKEKLVYYTEDHIVPINLQIKNRKIAIFSNLLNSHGIKKSYTLRFFKPHFNVEYVSDPVDFLSADVQPKSADLFKADLPTLKDLFSSDNYFGVIIMNQGDSIDLLEKSYALKQKYLRWYLTLNQRENVIKTKEEKWAMEKTKYSNPFKTLKKLIDIFFRSQLTCTSCSLVIKEKSEIFICPQSHIACYNCLKNYCQICKTDCLWINSRKIFQDVELTCDWINCSKMTPYWEFLFHKQVCEKRQYDCPLENCNFSGVKIDLINHWHSEDILLKSGKMVDFKTERDCIIYWIIDNLNEMLIIKVSSDNNTFYLNVSEELVIYPYNYKLELRYYHTTQFCYKVTAELSQNCNKKTYYYGLNRNEDFRLVLKFD